MLSAKLFGRSSHPKRFKTFTLAINLNMNPQLTSSACGCLWLESAPQETSFPSQSRHRNSDAANEPSLSLAEASYPHFSMNRGWAVAFGKMLRSLFGIFFPLPIAKQVATVSCKHPAVETGKPSVFAYLIWFPNTGLKSWKGDRQTNEQTNKLTS